MGSFCVVVVLVVVVVDISAHSYVTLSPGTARQMDFYSRVRCDGLLRRVESPGEMTETFEERQDLLFSRQVFYAHSTEEGGSENPGSRPLQVPMSNRTHKYKSSDCFSVPVSSYIQAAVYMPTFSFKCVSNVCVSRRWWRGSTGTRPRRPVRT